MGGFLKSGVPKSQVAIQVSILNCSDNLGVLLGYPRCRISNKSITIILFSNRLGILIIILLTNQ